MPQSLAAIYVHLVFSTKQRERVLTSEIRERLFPYLAAILNRHHSPALKVGGHHDHVHVLLRLPRTVALSELVGELKGESSKWLKREFPAFGGFAWQAGYGAFSVSASQLDEVSDYIIKQDLHHDTTSFQDEYRRLLNRFGVDYDERYVWD